MKLQGTQSIHLRLFTGAGGLNTKELLKVGYVWSSRQMYISIGDIRRQTLNAD